MKKHLIIGVLLACSAGVMRGQEPVRIERETVALKDNDHEKLKNLELGVRFMPTFSTFSFNTYNDEIVEGEATISYGYGAMVGINLSKNLGIAAEVNYNEISQRYKDRGLERTVKINYVNIPLMLSLNTDKTQPVNLNLSAGPQFGINIGSSINSSGNTNEDVDTLTAVIAVKPGDVGLAYGAGLEFSLNPEQTLRLDIGFRGFYGFVDIDADEAGDPDTYNVVVRAARKTYAGFAGITLLF